MLALVISIAILDSLRGGSYERLEEVGYAILGIRYGIQLYRIVSLVKISNDLRTIHNLGDIVLPDLEIMEKIENF